MKQALKGLLLSGLLLPGLGQIALGRKMRGYAIVVAVLAVVVGILVKAVSEAWAIVNELVQQTCELDFAALMQVSHQTLTTSDSALLTGLLLLLIVIWLASAIDAYVLGGKMDEGKS
jgi:TM2 domain-containing membrane protein YozV